MKVQVYKIFPYESQILLDAFADNLHIVVLLGFRYLAVTMVILFISLSY